MLCFHRMYEPRSRAHGLRELDEGLLWSIGWLSGIGEAAIEALHCQPNFLDFNCRPTQTQ